METYFRDLIQKELAKVPEANAAVRKMLYGKIRDAVLRKATKPDGVLDKAAAEKWTAGLDQAIAKIEEQYSEPDLSSLDSHLEKDAGRINTSGLLGMAGAVGAIGAALDFSSVFVDDVLGLSAMAAYMLAGFAGAAATSLFLRFGMFSEHSTGLRHGLRASVAVALVGALALGATMLSPEARERGLIAALVPGAAAVQDNLLGRPEKTAQETAETTKRIEEKVATLKKETSDDPCKELVNLGYACSLDSIHRAVLEGNGRVVGLYLQGGQSIPAETIAWFLHPPFKMPPDAEKSVTDELLVHGDQVSHDVCEKDSVNLGSRVWYQEEFLLNNEVPVGLRDFFVGFCKKETLLARYESRLAELERQRDGLAASQGEWEKSIEKCSAAITDKHRNAMDTADDFQASTLLENAWAEGFALARDLAGLGELSMAMVTVVTDEKTGVSLSINSLSFNGVNLRTKLADYAKRGCTFGMGKPEAPADFKFENVRKILALLKA